MELDREIVEEIRSYFEDLEDSVGDGVGFEQNLESLFYLLDESGLKKQSSAISYAAYENLTVAHENTLSYIWDELLDFLAYEEEDDDSSDDEEEESSEEEED